MEIATNEITTATSPTSAFAPFHRLSTPLPHHFHHHPFHQSTTFTLPKRSSISNHISFLYLRSSSFFYTFSYSSGLFYNSVSLWTHEYIHSTFHSLIMIPVHLIPFPHFVWFCLLVFSTCYTIVCFVISHSFRLISPSFSFVNSLSLSHQHLLASLWHYSLSSPRRCTTQ